VVGLHGAKLLEINTPDEVILAELENKITTVTLGLDIFYNQIKQ